MAWKNFYRVAVIGSCMTLISVMQPVMASIVIDGASNDWTENDRLDLPPGTPVAGYKLYGRYENNAYKLLLEAESVQIGAGTTIWLNTDQNVATGYQVFGFAGGSEFNVNLHTDGKPYLYNGAAAQNYLGGPLNHAVVQVGSGSRLELEIPEAQLGTPNGSAINLLVDVNNNTFMPSYYTADNHYALMRTALPPGGDGLAKRVGIVYSQSSSERFWSPKSYSQLFMSVQMQTIMAGVPFDLLTEQDLLDLNKLVKYDALVFPYSAYVPESALATIEQNLALASFQYGVGLVTAGNFLTNKADGSSLPGDAYARMKSLLGITRIDGAGPANITVRAGNASHKALAGEYQSGESLLTYSNAYTDYFTATGSYPVNILATQEIAGTGVRNAVLASETGGRNVHFGSLLHMGDSNLLWSALRWVVFGDDIPAALQLGRQKAIFVARNDMDQSMYVDQVATIEVPLLGLLQDWKQKYDFVGSYYINIGDNPTGGQYTDWSVSTPLYQQYIDLGNEIGTHSYTHPHNTNVINEAGLKFEFADSGNAIKQNLGLTTMGAAVPGAPENLGTSHEILKHVDYLTGGYSSTGAGFPNAIGFLTAADSKVYMSPNMTFDFTNIEFLGMTAEQTKQKWFGEFDSLTNHAKQAVLHWPWHDYGPFDPENKGYTVDMFESVIKKASEFGAEFMTGEDLRKRIESHTGTQLDVSQPEANVVQVDVNSLAAGRFAIEIPTANTAGKQIRSVDAWYAYDDDQVFTDRDGGLYRINLGNSADEVTRIYALPARAELVTLDGNGEDLSFTLDGEGQVKIRTKCGNTAPVITGVSTYNFNAASKELTLELNSLGTHTINVDVSCSS